MKQRQILHPAPSAAMPEIPRHDSCNLPTVVTGRILDEKGMPATGTKVSFFGRESRKNGIHITFDIVQRVAADGSYRIATVIPPKTGSAILRIEFSDYNFFLYTFDVKVNGELKGRNNSVEIATERHGKKTVADFQLRRL